MNFEDFLNKFHKELNESDNTSQNLIVNKYKDTIAKNISKFSILDIFYSLPFEVICSIIDGISFDIIEDPPTFIKNIISKSISSHKTEKGLCKILENIHCNSSSSLSFEECIKIISLFKTCDICVMIDSLYSEMDQAVDVDYAFQIDEQNKEIQKLKNELVKYKSLFNPFIGDTDSTSEIDSTTIKLACIGDTDTKTQLIYKLYSSSDDVVPNKLSKVYYPFRTSINYHKKKYTLDIWDTAGADCYSQFRKLIYPNTIFFLLVFSYDNLASFQKIDYFINEASSIVKNPKFILIGTMCNSARTTVTYDQVSSFLQAKKDTHEIIAHLDINTLFYGYNDIYCAIFNYLEKNSF